MKSSTGEPPIPVGEMITSDHSAANIQSFLPKWLGDAKNVNPMSNEPDQFETV